MNLLTSILHKTKMQVRREERYQGVVQTVRTVWQVCERLYVIFMGLMHLFPVKQRGMAGFFDGATLRLSRKVFSSAIGWAVYEGMLIFMKARLARQEQLRTGSA